MTTTFSEQLFDIRQQAQKQIRELVQKHSKITLLDRNEHGDIDVMIDDAFFDLPQEYRVHKHGFYINYHLIKAEWEKNNVSVFGVSSDGDEWDFGLEDLGIATLAELADELFKAVNPEACTHTQK
jgi:hypothetical protein